MKTHMIRMNILVLAALLLSACAMGDGRGFATVSGEMEAVQMDSDFTTSQGYDLKIESLNVYISHLQLESEASVLLGTERIVTVLPVDQNLSMVSNGKLIPDDAMVAFGPFEVDRGDYSILSAVITRMALKVKIDDNLTLEADFPIEDTVEIKAVADIAVGRDELPVVEIESRLAAPSSILDGVEPLTSEDAYQAMLKSIVNSLKSEAAFEATWVRTEDE